MAVSSTDTYSGPYVANGVTVAFPFTFKAISVDDVAVLIRPTSGSDHLVDPSAYNVTLASEGGTVTFEAAPASGDVYVVSEPSFLQSVIFASGQAFLPGVVNEVNDRDVVRALYLKREIDRAPKTPLGGGALGLYPVVMPDGSWGFSGGTGADDGLRGDLASGSGLNLLGDGTDIVLGSATPKEDVPQGNPYAPTFTKLSAKLFGDDEVLDGSRGFTFMAGVDNKGQAGTDNVDDMAAGYFGAEGTAYTSGDANTVRKPIWAINTVTFLHSGSGTYNARGIETDFVNSLRNIGSGDGAGYTSEVAAVGIEIFHSGPYQSTAGMLVNVGSDGSVPFYRAYAVAPGAASQAAFADYSDAAYSYDSRGSHAYGLHFVGTYSYNVLNGPLRVGDTSNPEAGIQLDVGGSGNAKVRGFLNVVGATNLEGALGVKLDGTLKAVSVGAADSGGSGYKVLRVAN